MPYEDAVEEALCFGWVDSIIKKIDSKKYARKFTPRKDNSIWSQLNRKRASKMIKEKKKCGLGVELMRRIMDSVEYKTVGNINTCEMIKWKEKKSAA